MLSHSFLFAFVGCAFGVIYIFKKRKKRKIIAKTSVKELFQSVVFWEFYSFRFKLLIHFELILVRVRR